jgi:replicative DNA helicase
MRAKWLCEKIFFVQNLYPNFYFGLNFMAKSNSTVPPHSLEAEKSTLGALLIDKDAILKIAEFLRPEDFYHQVHSIIYEAVASLYDKRSPIDLVTLTNYFEERGTLKGIGGATYLAELANAVPTATHVFQYASIVKQKSTLRKLIKSGHDIAALGYDEELEVDKLLEQAEKSIFGVSQTFLKDKFVHIKDVLEGTYEKIADLHDPEAKNQYRGIPTGFTDLDNKLSGLQPSDLVVIAARPSMGKTALALNMAQNSAKKGTSVGIMSLEMSKEQLVERMFCSLLGVDSWKMRTGKLTDDDFAKIGGIMDDLNSMKIYIDDSVGNSITEMRAKARRLQMEHGLDMLIIDYLQLMSGSGTSYGQGNRVQEISEISRSLKGLARELNIPILALSQLSRAVEQRPSRIPQLSDLRESGAIEQDADVVLMLYREDYYEEDTDRAGITDIFIRKHRNGPIGRIELAFKKEQMKFVSIETKRKAPAGVPM